MGTPDNLALQLVQERRQDISAVSLLGRSRAGWHDLRYRSNDKGLLNFPPRLAARSRLVAARISGTSVATSYHRPALEGQL